jgi:hypothetical protein
MGGVPTAPPQNMIQTVRQLKSFSRANVTDIMTAVHSRINAWHFQSNRDKKYIDGYYYKGIVQYIKNRKKG